MHSLLFAALLVFADAHASEANGVTTTYKHATTVASLALAAGQAKVLVGKSVSTRGRPFQIKEEASKWVDFFQ